ncbi:MAG: exosortase/archaeosortase family protein [Flavobacteriales bacterium]|nr:exosortase/archaeosortase family protein [Flavobacteriales bacterium]MCX7650468.1 exosortase/archaeosortase family protein [Flavobacteriales bacterium]MDW8432522.1 exosortase/archaeosortase family protein [Flavobacteriales bacterium]
MSSRGVFLKKWDRAAAWSTWMFLLKMTTVYGMWKVFQWTGGMPLHWWESGTGWIGWWHDVLAPAFSSLSHEVGKALLNVSHFILADVLRLPAGMALEVRDYKGIPEEFRLIWLPGARGINIAESCLGIAPMVVLAGAVIAYPGPWYHKLWFIPAGMLAAQAGNVFRVVGLVLIQKHVPREVMFKLSHSYVYLFICYGIVFLWIRWWIRKFGTP